MECSGFACRIETPAVSVRLRSSSIQLWHLRYHRCLVVSLRLTSPSFQPFGPSRLRLDELAGSLRSQRASEGFALDVYGSAAFGQPHILVATLTLRSSGRLLTAFASRLCSLRSHMPSLRSGELAASLRSDGRIRFASLTKGFGHYVPSPSRSASPR